MNWVINWQEIIASTIAAGFIGIVRLEVSLWIARKKKNQELENQESIIQELRSIRTLLKETKQRSMLKGIDISKYQGQPDFDAISRDLDFVLMRSSIGCPDPGENPEQYRDSQFARNQSEARRVGILRGFYHAARPDFNDPIPEAEQFVYSIGDLKAGEVVALDFEVSTNKDVVDWCFQFLSRVYILTGIKPLLYIDLSHARGYDWSPVVQAGFGLWLARWDYNPDGSAPATQWPVIAFRQYSNHESVGGLNPVDGDVFYGDSGAFQKYGKPEIVVEAAVEQPVLEVPAPPVVIPDPVVPVEPANIPAPVMDPVPFTPPHEEPTQPVIEKPMEPITDGQTVPVVVPGYKTSLQTLEGKFVLAANIVYFAGIAIAMVVDLAMKEPIFSKYSTQLTTLSAAVLWFNAYFLKIRTNYKIAMAALMNGAN